MKMFRIILAAWVLAWLFFTVRGLIVEKDKSTLKDYISLVSADWEGKRAIVFGKDLYEFIKFCKANLPTGAGYEIIGIPEDSIDLPRLVYYLYPSIKKRDADFILVYKKLGFEEKEAYLYASLNKESFILKRK
ncbi:MAG: hypothetical protein KKB22_07315 [Candidatus Omnitrophica bacterium]|nr:hypothetical protein [Candidatus Omnitrophota bacterium]